MDGVVWRGNGGEEVGWGVRRGKGGDSSRVDCDGEVRMIRRKRMLWKR